MRDSRWSSGGHEILPEIADARSGVPSTARREIRKMRITNIPRCTDENCCRLYTQRTLISFVAIWMKRWRGRLALSLAFPVLVLQHSSFSSSQKGNILWAKKVVGSWSGQIYNSESKMTVRQK